MFILRAQRLERVNGTVTMVKHHHRAAWHALVVKKKKKLQTILTALYFLLTNLFSGATVSLLLFTQPFCLPCSSDVRNYCLKRLILMQRIVHENSLELNDNYLLLLSNLNFTRNVYSHDVSESASGILGGEVCEKA